MNIDAVNFAKQTVKARKYNAEYIAEKNLLLISENEEFKKNNIDIQSVEISLAKANVDGLTEEYDKLLVELDELLKIRDTILKKLGYSQSDFSPAYNCRLCNDTGLYNNKICKCVKKIINDELMIKNRIDFSSLDSFDDWDTSKFSSKAAALLTDAKNIVMKEISNFNTMRSILLSGKSGTGKTFLQNCIATYFYSKGYIVSYNTAFSFLDIVKEYHTTFSSENKSDLLDSLLDSDVLIIDDLGTEPIITNITCEYLYTVLNHRMINKKPTIISTNLSVKGLIDRYGQRVVSRITNEQRYLCLLFDFENLRAKKY